MQLVGLLVCCGSSFWLFKAVGLLYSSFFVESPGLLVFHVVFLFVKQLICYFGLCQAVCLLFTCQLVWICGFLCPMGSMVDSIHWFSL